MLFPCKCNHGPTGPISELPPLLPPSPYGTALHVSMGGSPVVLMSATDATEFLFLVSSTGEALESTLNAMRVSKSLPKSEHVVQPCNQPGAECANGSAPDIDGELELAGGD